MRVVIPCAGCSAPACSIEPPDVAPRFKLAAVMAAKQMGAGAIDGDGPLLGLEPAEISRTLDVRCSTCAPLAPVAPAPLTLESEAE